MAKIRGFKPDLWTDDNFVELSPFARLLWLGMWNYACDNGHLQDKSKQIKMRVLPTDDVNCADLLREIEGQGLIVRDAGWITIPNLTHHQKPHKRWYVVCDKPGCEHPEGTSYGWQKTGSQPESTVEQPLVNGENNDDNRCSTADVDGDGDVELMVMVTKAEADASSPPARSLALVNDHRPDVDHICAHLAEAVESTGAKKPSVTTKWRTEARLMLDRDGRTVAEVDACIRWLYGSTHKDALFWRPNVRAMPKLRAEYDRLLALSQRRMTSSRGPDLDSAMQRARAKEAQMRGEGA